MSPTTSPSGRRIQLRLSRSLPVGVAAGLASLAIDELSSILTLGMWTPLPLPLLGVYASTGITLALLIEASLLLCRRSGFGFWRAVGIVTAAIYAPAVWLRIYTGLETLVPLPAAIASAVAAVAGYGLGILFLVRLVSSRSTSAAWFLGSLTAGIGLALGREGAFRAATLAAAAALLLAVAAVALLARFAGPRQALAAGAALAFAAALVSLSHSPVAVPPAPGAARHPNLVLMVIDTLRRDVFQAVVDETVEGRTFQRALGGAAWFGNAIAASPWTAPSVGSIMTGMYPKEHQLGTFETRDGERLSIAPLAKSVPTLAEGLRQQGYWTEALVASFLSPNYGLARGFIRYDICTGPEKKMPLLSSLVRLGLLSIPLYLDAGDMRRLFQKRFKEIAKTQNRSFFFLHFMDPHVPLLPHRDLSPDPASADMPETERLYRDEVRYALREVANILEILRSRDRWWRETALVVVSDHGEMFPSDDHFNGVADTKTGEPMLYGHGHALYEELARVPLVIRPPGGLPVARQIDALTSHVDLYDTLIDLLGVDIPRKGGDRVSLAPWLGRELTAPSPTRAHTLISMNLYGPRQRALRTRDYKLIAYENGSRELYAIAVDSAEKDDIADKEVDLLREASDQLEEHWSQLEEPPPAPAMVLDAEARKRLEALGYIN